MELLSPADPEVAALDTEEANIRTAEAAYRADPELARDLEESGWFPERTQAAKEGRAVRGEGRRQAAPVLQLPVPTGQVRLKPSAWAGFVNLLADVGRRRVELLEERRPAIQAVIAEQEATLRQRVLRTPVGDLVELVAETDELLLLAVTARGPIPRTVRTSAGLAPAKYRERTDALELIDAALGNWSLLDPIPPGEPTSLVTSQLGVQRDLTPSPTVGEVTQDAASRYGTSRVG
jgi:hypothetical protein